MTRTSLTLEPPTDAPFGSPISVRRDAQMRYWWFQADALPIVFDSVGRYVGRVGRMGKGPGEFLGAHDLLVTPGDSVVVLDGSGYRAIVFDALLRPVRHVAVPFRPHNALAIRWPDSVIAAGRSRSRVQAGFPLHRLDFSGERALVRHSFLPGAEELRPGVNSLALMDMTASSNGHFWAAWRFGYDVFKWTNSGHLVNSFERRPTWFQGVSSPEWGAPDRAPPPHMTALLGAGPDTLWTFVAIPGPRWKGAWPTGAEKQREIDAGNVAVDELFMTMVEVIDTKRLRVIARRQLDAFVVSVLPGMAAAAYEVDDAGVRRMRLIELSLHKP